MRSDLNRARSAERKKKAERAKAQRRFHLKPCAHHKPCFRNDYLAWHADAAVRHARGEKQVRCPDCSLWYWPHELGERPL